MKFDIAYQTLRAIALCHNYNIWIYEMIKAYLGNNILEVGCGIGNLTEYLKKGRTLVAIDTNQKYIEYMKLDFMNMEIYNCDIVMSEILYKKNHIFDTIVCINVLEHIKEDKVALRNMYNLIQRGGQIVLIVPSHQFLYGSLDKNVGHYRRYERKELIDKVKQTGFKVKDIFYFNRLGTMSWLLNGRVRKKKEISFFQLILFDRMMPIIKKIDYYLNLPFGLSLALIAEKE